MLVIIMQYCTRPQNPNARVSFLCVFQIHTIAIIAEGIPEAMTRKIIKKADEKGVTIIGPATVQQLCNSCISYILTVSRSK